MGFSNLFGDILAEIDYTCNIRKPFFCFHLFSQCRTENLKKVWCHKMKMIEVLVYDGKFQPNRMKGLKVKDIWKCMKSRSFQTVSILHDINLNKVCAKIVLHIDFVCKFPFFLKVIVYISAGRFAVHV